MSYNCPPNCIICSEERLEDAELYPEDFIDDFEVDEEELID